MFQVRQQLRTAKKKLQSEQDAALEQQARLQASEAKATRAEALAKRMDERRSAVESESRRLLAAVESLQAQVLK